MFTRYMLLFQFFRQGRSHVEKCGGRNLNRTQEFSKQEQIHVTVESYDYLQLVDKNWDFHPSYLHW